MADQQAREISVEEAYKFIAEELSADNPKLIAGAEKLKKEHPGKMTKQEIVQGMWKQIPELGQGFSLSGVSNVGQTPQKSDKPPGADKPSAQKDQPPGAEKKGFLSSMGEVINPFNVAKGLVAPYTNLYHEAKQLLGDMTGDQPGASKGSNEFLHKWTEPTPEAPPLKEVPKRIAYGTPVVGESIRDVAEEGNWPAAAGHLAGNLVLLAVLRKFGIKAGEGGAVEEGGAVKEGPKLESAYKEWRDTVYKKGKKGHYEDKDGNVFTDERLREDFHKAVAHSGGQEPTTSQSKQTPAPPAQQTPKPEASHPEVENKGAAPTSADEAPKHVDPSSPSADPQAEMRNELERLKAENEKLKSAPQEEPAKPKRQTAKQKVKERLANAPIKQEPAKRASPVSWKDVPSDTPPGARTPKPPASWKNIDEGTPRSAETAKTPPGAKTASTAAPKSDKPPGAKPKPKSLDAADPDPAMIKKGKYTEKSFNEAQDALLEQKKLGRRYVTITPLAEDGKVAGPGISINVQEYSTGALEDVAEKLHVPKFHHVKVDLGRVVPKE